MLKFVLLKPSFTSINCNDEINNHSFQTISNSCLISLKKLIFLIKSFLYLYFFNFNYNIYYVHLKILLIIRTNGPNTKHGQAPRIYVILFWQRQRPHTAKNNKIIRILKFVVYHDNI